MANSAMFLIRVAAAMVVAADALQEEHSPRHHGVKVHKSGVKVSIFYETLCPACLYFFSHEMKTLVDTHSVMDAAELEFVPYGNAVTNGGTVTCQHGIKECELNMLHACAIKNLPAKETPAWVQCAMGVGAVGNKQPKDVLDSCKASNADKIWACFGGGSNQEAINLHLEHGKRTASAGQQYTPYMLLNDQHSKEAENDISRAICGAIQGTKPEGCRSLPNTLIRTQSTVTYRDDKTTLHKYSLPFTGPKTEKQGKTPENNSNPMQAAAVSASGAVDGASPSAEDEEEAEEETPEEAELARTHHKHKSRSKVHKSRSWSGRNWNVWACKHGGKCCVTEHNDDGPVGEESCLAIDGAGCQDNSDCSEELEDASSDHGS